jgi:hypothetical protein
MMRLGFMQPYFLPYPGYFALIARCDRWLVFDDAQMIRHGWVDRNRVLHPTEGWMYIKVPLKKHPREALISACEVADADWGGRVLRQLSHYRRAPYHAPVMAVLEAAFGSAPGALAALNVHVLSAVCAYIGLPFAPVLHSSLDYDRSRVQGPGDWALEAARAVGADAYLNPVGGAALFDGAAFAAAGVRLEFLRWPDTPYPQRRPAYEPALSMLDMLFWLSPDEVRARLAGAEISAAPAPSAGEAR